VGVQQGRKPEHENFDECNVVIRRADSTDSSAGLSAVYSGTRHGGSGPGQCVPDQFEALTPKHSFSIHFPIEAFQKRQKCRHSSVFRVVLLASQDSDMGSIPITRSNQIMVRPGEILYRTFLRHALHFRAKRVF
jgi:hypothetical protein